MARGLWRSLWPLARLLAAYFPYQRRRIGPIPDGPVVLGINHFSHLDPPLAGLAVVRPTRFLALDELWGHSRILDVMFRVFGVIPLPRSGRHPIAAMRASLRELEAGGVVGVFPEGRRVRAWGESETKRGAAWLAVRTGALLVPVTVWGTQNAMPVGQWRIRRASVTVVLGEPLDPARYAGQDDPIGALTEAWHRAVDAEMNRLDRA